MHLAWPLPDDCHRITQRFGERPDFYRRFDLAGHEGLDIACPIGTPVYAAHDGWCAPQWGEDYGDQIWLYGDGVMTLYAHLSQVTVGIRQRVQKGEQIGST